MGPIYDDFAHPERDDKRLPGDWKDAHPDAIPSSPGDLDGSADVSRRVSVDVMRKPERHSLTLTCGTDYDGFAHPERREWDVLAATRRTNSGRDTVVSG